MNVVSGVPQGSVFCPLLFLLYTSQVLTILENELIGHATLYIVICYLQG